MTIFLNSIFPIGHILKTIVKTIKKICSFVWFSPFSVKNILKGYLLGRGEGERTEKGKLSGQHSFFY